MYAVVCDVGEHVLKTKAGQDFSVLACPPVVELPGIEPYRYRNRAELRKR
jgi:hypothetical protein